MSTNFEYSAIICQYFDLWIASRKGSAAACTVCACQQSKMPYLVNLYISLSAALHFCASLWEIPIGRDWFESYLTNPGLGWQVRFGATCQVFLPRVRHAAVRSVNYECLENFGTKLVAGSDCSTHSEYVGGHFALWDFTRNHSHMDWSVCLAFRSAEIDESNTYLTFSRAIWSRSKFAVEDEQATWQWEYYSISFHIRLSRGYAQSTYWGRQLCMLESLLGQCSRVTRQESGAIQQVNWAQAWATA